MSTLFVGGLMAVRLVFLAKKVRDSEIKIEQEQRMREIEQELQQVKDKVFLEQFF